MSNFNVQRFSTEIETPGVENIVHPLGLLFVRGKQGPTDVGDECRGVNDDGSSAGA